MSRPAIAQQTMRFPRVERDAPIFMPFVIKREKELEYDKEELGAEFYSVINESFEDVINKAVDLFVLASQSPRSFKMIDVNRNSNPKKFREEMAQRYESLDYLQKAYVDLDKLMILDLWRQRYGADICLVSAMSTIAAGAMIFIDQQIDKQLKPQKHVTWGEAQVLEEDKATKLSGEAKSQERSGDF